MKQYVDDNDWDKLTDTQKQRIIRLGFSTWFYKGKIIERQKDGSYHLIIKSIDKSESEFNTLINYIDNM